MDYEPTIDKLKRINTIIESSDDKWLDTYDNVPENLVVSYIHVENSTDIGFVNLFRLKTGKTYSNNIVYLVYGVKAEYQKQGYSRWLLKTAIKSSTQLQFKEVQCRVDKENIASIKAVERTKWFVLKRELKTENIYSRELV